MKSINKVSSRTRRPARAAGEKARPRWILPIPTSEGSFTAVFTDRGLSRLYFPSRAPTGRTDRVHRVPARVRKWRALTQGALQQCLRGADSRELPAFDWSEATPFQQQVWRALLRIRAGKTASYGDVACRVGRDQAARAVGSACGANPIPVLVPCHRVLASNGRLGGFSGGLNWKRRLLKTEGVAVSV